MNILGISLLRLGDLTLQRPLIEAVRKKHPHSVIHLLVNRQFAQVEFLFEGLVDKFIYFDREALQKSCGEKEYNIFWGLHQLESLVHQLNETSYDSVYNFTHNRLSAHIAGLIRARTRFGIYSLQGNFYGLATPWIQFFNNFFGRPEAAGFHYTELLAKALDIPLEQKVPSKTRSFGKKKIFIQPLTSDSKKNWDLTKYQNLVSSLEAYTSFEVKVLGAPFETPTLEKYFSEKNLLICDFKEAASALQEGVLLVTGDTSVKHLAAIYEVPILELSLGSSQPLQTGAYSNNSLILQSRVACGPCPHSEKCSQATHRCSENLSHEAVFKAVRMLLNLERADWNLFSQRHPGLNVLSTEIRESLGWTVQCFSLAQKEQFEKILQKKTMIVQELDRRHQSVKGVSHEQRSRKLPLIGA